MALLSGPRLAFADEAAARAHFKKGIELYDHKRYADALTAFQDAYREKPSAGIKQNIALSLKGLGRLDEAATSLDEALDEGKDTLKPETRAAIERELATLTTSVATVTFAAEDEQRRPVGGALVTMTDGRKSRSVPVEARRKPVRLMPGTYTFTAHAAGQVDPPEKKLALESGAPVDVTFQFRSGGAAAGAVQGPDGALEITTNLPDAVVRVDGVELPQRGGFHGRVPAGTRNVTVSSPGFKTTTFEVTVTPGGSVVQDVKMQAIGEAPPEYVAPLSKPVKEKRAYVAFNLALDVASYRLGVPLGEKFPYGARRGFGGGTLDARIGYRFAKMFALEGYLDVGAMNAKYKLAPTDTDDTKTRIVHWQLTPMLRFVTPGKVRFTAATGFGVHGLGVETEPPAAAAAATATRKGQGVGFSWLVDAGMQITAGPVFLDFALFVDVHGVGPVKEENSDYRLLYASPATRGGLRAGVGIPF